MKEVIEHPRPLQAGSLASSPYVHYYWRLIPT
jgi:hypothetical protein